LLLVPTHELALQIAEAVSVLGAYLPSPPKTVVAVGGLSINPQMLALRGGADIVVATPGRLLDLVDNNALSLAGCRSWCWTKQSDCFRSDLRQSLRG
jgi:ATP-dependent RNA helicase RhlE